MSDDLVTSTLAFKVVSDCLRLEEQKVARLELECDGYVQEIVELRMELALVKQQAEDSALGYETSNIDMHRAMVKANREVENLRAELREARR